MEGFRKCVTEYNNRDKNGDKQCVQQSRLKTGVDDKNVQIN